MNIHVDYSAQPRFCAGCAEETFQLNDGAGLADLPASGVAGAVMAGLHPILAVIGGGIVGLLAW